jgi:putative ABC transport system permease protein
MGNQITRWKIVGLVESVSGHSGGIFITAAGYEAASGVSQPNLLRIVTREHDEDTRTEVAQAAQQTLTRAGFVVRAAESVSRTEAAGAGHMLPLILVFLSLSISISVVGFAGLTSTMSTNVLERTREFGVMRAIGASTSTVRGIVVLEGVFIAAVSCLVGAVLTPLLTALMIGTLTLPVNLPFLISAPGVMIWVVTVLLGAAGATLAPASQASSLTVRETLAYL